MHRKRKCCNATVNMMHYHGCFSCNACASFWPSMCLLLYL